MAFRDVQLEWIPAGVPWWRPLEETKAAQLAVAAKFKTRSQNCRERLGKSFREVVDRLAEEEEYMKSKGLATAVNINGPVDPEQRAQDDDDDERDDTDDNEDE